MRFNLNMVEEARYISVKTATFNRDGQSVTSEYVALVVGNDEKSDVGNLLCTSVCAQEFKKLPQFTPVEICGVFDTYKKEFVVAGFKVKES